MNSLKSIVAAGALAFAVSGQAVAEEYGLAHIASPDQYQVLLENEQVLVLKMVLEPGEADLVHRHHNETVYFQNGGTLSIANPDGEAMEVEVPDGHVMWHEAWAHQVTNVGDTQVVAIIVEAKN